MVTDYLEGALSRRDRRRIEHHLAGCPHCTAYLEQMRETLRLTGRSCPRICRRRCSASSARSTSAGGPTNSNPIAGRTALPVQSA